MDDSDYEDDNIYYLNNLKINRIKSKFYINENLVNNVIIII